MLVVESGCVAAEWDSRRMKSFQEWKGRIRKWWENSPQTKMVG